MIKLRESMGPDRDQTHDSCICSQTRICSQYKCDSTVGIIFIYLMKLFLSMIVCDAFYGPVQLAQLSYTVKCLFPVLFSALQTFSPPLTQLPLIIGLPCETYCRVSPGKLFLSPFQAAYIEISRLADLNKHRPFKVIIYTPG